MANPKNMRLGVVMHGYPPPPDLAPEKRLEWLLDRAAELQLGTLHIGWVENDRGYIQRIGEQAAAADIELELGAPGVFGLVGPEAQESRAALIEAIGIAKQLGCKIMRTGYGRLNVETSRFNPDIPLAEHLGILTRNLREAGRIFADHGLLLAIENHCDFTGKDFVTVFSEVNSPAVGCALDTANGYTVYCDPNEDVQDLAPFAFTTHMKDMKVINWGEPGRIPLLAVGTACGEGGVDLPLAIKTLSEKSPYAEGLHLIVETGWVPVPAEVDRTGYMRDIFHRSLAYLRSIL